MGFHRPRGCGSRGEMARRFGRGAQLEGASAGAVGRVPHGVIPPRQAVVFRVADDADDFVTGTRRPVCASCRFAEWFTERVFLADVFLDVCLVHDHLSRRGSWSASARPNGKLDIVSVVARAVAKGEMLRLA